MPIPTVEPADAVLVASATRGDPTAFAVLVRRYERAVRGVCFAVLHDPHLADDAAQEAFLSAFRGLGNLRNPRTFCAWILTIARREAVRLARSRRRSEPLPADAPAVPGALEQDDRLLAAVAALPEQERTVVLLRYYQSLDVATIAEKLDRPIGSHAAAGPKARDA